MASTIALRFPAKCKDCGAALAVGATARYYGYGKVYGTECHEQTPRSGIEIVRPIRPKAQKRPERDPEPSAPASAKAPKTPHDAATVYAPTPLIAGKDYRRTIGKATFSGKGAATKCTSFANWGRPIFSATSDQLACCRSITRLAHVLGYRAKIWAARDPFRISVYWPDFPDETSAFGSGNLTEVREQVAKIEQANAKRRLAA